jgi:anti-sigma factor RsiW
MGPLARRAHRRLRESISAYVDGQLDPYAARRVARHLQECWWCSEDAEFALLIKESLRRNRTRHPDVGVARLRRWAAQL